MKYIVFVLFSFFLLNCKNVKQDVSDTSTTLSTGDKLTAQSVIDKSIEVAGSELLNASNVSFTFRNVRYKAFRDYGQFSLLRLKDEGKNWIVDSLSNAGFTRKVNDEVVEVPDSMAVKYTASVNSVHYFSVLPYGLNDNAVNKELLEDISIKNKMYSAVKVTFNQNGGGEDFEDEFMYWIHKETNTIDYLAYSYNESDGKGIRFREAYNERNVEGVRFVDYNNYKPEDSSMSLTDLPQLFESAKLNLLSKIELENIKVKLN